MVQYIGGSIYNDLLFKKTVRLDKVPSVKSLVNIILLTLLYVISPDLMLLEI